MTCVLARPSLYSSNPRSGHTVSEGRVQNISWEDYDLNWISSTTSPVLHCTEELWSQRNLCKSEKNDNACDRQEPKSHEMCNQKRQTDVKPSPKGVKRKAAECDFDEIFIPPKRISPFLNTPKERKDERRKLIKISVQKIKAIEDAELSLRRSVLINNTMKRVKSELRKETKLSTHSMKRKKQRLGYGMLNNDCLSESYLVDDPFLSGVQEKITDDMTDILMNNLENKIGVRIACLSSVKDKFSAQKPCQTDENNDVECEVMDYTTSSNATTLAINQRSGMDSSDLRTALKTSESISTIPKSCPVSLNVSQTNLSETEVTIDTQECSKVESLVNDEMPLKEDIKLSETIEDINSKFSERTKSADKAAVEGNEINRCDVANEHS